MWIAVAGWDVVLKVGRASLDDQRHQRTLDRICVDLRRLRSVRQARARNVLVEAGQLLVDDCRADNQIDAGNVREIDGGKSAAAPRVDARLSHHHLRVQAGLGLIPRRVDDAYVELNKGLELVASPVRVLEIKETHTQWHTDRHKPIVEERRDSTHACGRRGTQLVRDQCIEALLHFFTLVDVSAGMPKARSRLALALAHADRGWRDHLRRRVGVEIGRESASHSCKLERKLRGGSLQEHLVDANVDKVEERLLHFTAGCHDKEVGALEAEMDLVGEGLHSIVSPNRVVPPSLVLGAVPAKVEALGQQRGAVNPAGEPSSSSAAEWEDTIRKLHRRTVPLAMGPRKFTQPLSFSFQV
eukprot:3328818-Rhodomonas_salina.2